MDLFSYISSVVSVASRLVNKNSKIVFCSYLIILMSKIHETFVLKNAVFKY
jgi:hypothetical protein